MSARSSDHADHADELSRVGGDPDLTARWWHALAPKARRQLLDEQPARLGGTDGVPAAVRDRANRQTLADRRGDLEAVEARGELSTVEACELANVRTIADNLELHRATIDPHTGRPTVVELYVFDPAAFGGDGRAAIAIGGLDSADHLAVDVPGFSSSVAGMVPGAADRLYVEARWAAGRDESVAVVDWMGYDSPNHGPGDLELDDDGRTTEDKLIELFERMCDGAGVLSPAKALAGAELLARDVAGLVAMHGDHDIHLTVVGSSYGSTTTAIAAADHHLAADDVVLVGSPGAGTAERAADLTTGRRHTWVASASSDLVTWLGDNGGWNPFDGVTGSPLGIDPADQAFGGQRMRAESLDRSSPLWPPSNLLAEHGRYFDSGSEALFNTAAVVAGDTAAVMRAAPREQEPTFEFDAGLDINVWPTEPEAQRAPTSMSHAVTPPPSAEIGEPNT